MPPDPEAVARLLDQRETQGLPRHVVDPIALGAVATVVTSARDVSIRGGHGAPDAA